MKVLGNFVHRWEDQCLHCSHLDKDILADKCPLGISMWKSDPCEGFIRETAECCICGRLYREWQTNSRIRLYTNNEKIPEHMRPNFICVVCEKG